MKKYTAVLFVLVFASPAIADGNIPGTDFRVKQDDGKTVVICGLDPAGFANEYPDYGKKHLHFGAALLKNAPSGVEFVSNGIPSGGTGTGNMTVLYVSGTHFTLSYLEQDVSLVPSDRSFSATFELQMLTPDSFCRLDWNDLLKALPTSSLVPVTLDPNLIGTYLQPASTIQNSAMQTQDAGPKPQVVVVPRAGDAGNNFSGTNNHTAE
jgi:hypothetical protein